MATCRLFQVGRVTFSHHLKIILCYENYTLLVPVLWRD